MTAGPSWAGTIPPDRLRPAARVTELRPTAINSILAEVRALREQSREVVSLMRGEPDFPTPPHIVAAAEAALRAGRTSYPDNRGEISLREAVSAKLTRENAVQYDPSSEILITDGATLGIGATVMALLNPDDEILVPDPIYDAYASPIRIAGARPVPVKSRRGDHGRFEIDVDALEAACTPSTRALLLNDPWNPTGTVLRRTEVEQISDFVLRRGLLLVSDEIYEAITYGDAVHVSPASLSPEVRSRCVLVNSLSKTYSMTGWRVGYCAAPDWCIRAMLLVLQQTSRGPATFVQDAAAHALMGPQDCVADMRAEYARRRQTVIDTLAGLPCARVLAPEGGFFAMVDIADSGRTSQDVRRFLLSECGIAVVHGSAYGECGEGTLRVSFASGGRTLDAGLKLLRQGLQQI